MSEKKKSCIKHRKSISLYLWVFVLLISCTRSGTIQTNEAKVAHRWGPSFAQLEHSLQCKYHFSTSQLALKLIHYLNQPHKPIQRDLRPFDKVVEIFKDAPQDMPRYFKLTQAFPHSWPKQQGKVTYFAYPEEILGTGEPQTKIFAPVYAMIADPKTGEFEMHSLPLPAPSQYIKDQDIIIDDSFWYNSELSSQALELAENRLIAYTLGCISLTEFQPSLVTYYEWKENESFLFEHIKPHIGTFLD